MNIDHLGVLAQSSNSDLGFLPAIICLAIAVLVIVGFWKVFTKAGEPGWASIIPIYNIFVLLRIAGRPWWFLILFFIPIVNIFVDVVVSVDVAKAFGKGIGFGIGLWLLPFIFYPILGFGSAQYQGPST